MRGGNDYLFQSQAQANIEIMNGYGVKEDHRYLSARL